MKTQVNPNSTKAKVRLLSQHGMNILEISHHLKIAPPTLYAIMKNPENSQRKTRKDAGTSKQIPNACECGTIKMACSRSCRNCANNAAALKKQELLNQRKIHLLDYANDTGRVPTVKQAMKILKIGSSVAADAIIHTFGRDKRKGFDRRQPRPYPTHK